MIIIKGSEKFQIATTTTLASIALLGLSSALPMYPQNIEMKNISLVSEINTSDISNQSYVYIPKDYYNTTSLKEKLWQLFDENRDLTEDELTIYHNILTSDAEETGIRLY